MAPQYVVRVDISGLDELNAALTKHAGQLAAASDAGHRQLAEQQAAQIRANAPRPPGRSGEGTGAIASRVRVKRHNPFMYDVVVGEEGVTTYLGHYEFGTRHQPARPFVRPPASRAEVAHKTTMLAYARARLG